MIVCSIPKGAKSQYKKVTFVYIEDKNPKYVVKTSKYPSKEKEFAKEFKDYKKLYSLLKIQNFPKPYFTFKMNNLLFSLEEGLNGKRLIPNKNWGKHFSAFLSFLNELSKKGVKGYNKELINVFESVLNEMNPKLSKKEKEWIKNLINKSKNKKWVSSLGDFGYGNSFFDKGKIKFVDWERNKVIPMYFPLIGFISAYFSYLKFKKDKRYLIDLTETLKNKKLKKMIVDSGIDINDLLEDYGLACLFSYKTYKEHDKKVMELQTKKLKKLISSFES